MAKVTIDSITDEQVEKLTEEQQKALEETGEVEIEDTPYTQTPPAGDDGEALPPDDTGEKTAAVTPDSTELQKQLEEIRAENERLRRESEGRLHEVIELRQKARKAKEETDKEGEKSQFADLLSDIEDDEFIDAKRYKATVQRLENYISKKEQEFNKAVEAKVAQLEADRMVARFEESRKRAEAKHPDYTTKVTEFFKSLSPLEAEMIQMQLSKSQDPAEDAYALASRLSLLKQGETLNNAQRRQVPKVLTGQQASVKGGLTVEKFASMTDAEIAKLEREHPEQIRELHRQLGEV